MQAGCPRVASARLSVARPRSRQLYAVAAQVQRLQRAAPNYTGLPNNAQRRVSVDASPRRGITSHCRCCTRSQQPPSPAEPEHAISSCRGAGGRNTWLQSRKSTTSQVCRRNPIKHNHVNAPAWLVAAARAGGDRGQVGVGLCVRRIRSHVSSKDIPMADLPAHLATRAARGTHIQGSHAAL